MQEVKAKFLESCDMPLQEFKVEPFTMVIFGGAGDLSKRKLVPAVFHLYLDGELSEGFSIVGYGMPEMSDDAYRRLMKDAVREFGGAYFDEGRWSEFSGHLFYVSGTFKDDKKYKKLCDKLGGVSTATEKGTKDVIYYMAVPPDFVPVIVEKLRLLNLCKGDFSTKIIAEKPFGRDWTTARKLNEVLRGAFDEGQIYRIDHYLGKETVQNIIFFRFSNSIFEPLWNRRYIDHIQITVAEDLGVEHRGAFYEEAGVVRDIVQNHMMQLIALVAMEPPVGFAPDLIRDEKVKIFRSIRLMNEEFVDRFTVRGQYGPGRVNGEDVVGYREENDVAGDSVTPTFIAAKIYIDNWRWAGVPFYIRTGKRLARRATEIVVQFKQPPLKLFGKTCDALEPNLLILAIQPEERISIRFGVKHPDASNAIYPVVMDFGYEEAFKMKGHLAYERLLVDTMKGDLTLFVRQDGVEAMWVAVYPIIARWENRPQADFPNYTAGSWGPKEADELLEKEGRKWRNP